MAAASLLRRSDGAVRRYYHGFRRYFATQSPEIGNRRRRQQQQQLPWLLLPSSTDNPESRYLYGLTGDDRKPIAFNREIHLPQIAGHHLIGSSQGYLFSVDPIGEIHATDPLTGARLLVPSTTALPNCAGVFRDPAGNSRTHYVMYPHEPPLDNILPQLSLFEHRHRVGGGGTSLLASLDPEQVDFYDLHEMKKYYVKAILSPCLNTAVVIHQDYRICYRRDNNLPAFARIGSSAASSSSWNALYSPSYRFQDVIFHQGRLHAVDLCGTLVVFDLDDPLGQPLVSPKGPVDNDVIGVMKVFLVESPDGEDLFLVFGTFGGCSAFKLDKSSYKWNQADSIGDVAIFLGSNQSIAFTASDFSGIITPNCIYLADEYRARHIGNPYGKTGVYNLGDRTIKHYVKHNWPPPMWFMPTAR